MRDKEATALIVVDMQESFRVPGMGWESQSNPQVIDNVAAMVEHAREVGDLIVWITHADPGSGSPFDPQLGQVTVFPEFATQDGELQITKTSINSFTSTNLQQCLTKKGIRRLIITGIRTDQCCETTARVGSDLGYAVDFVTEATSTTPILARDGLAALTGEEIMRRTESVLAARGFASITTVADYLTEAPRQ